jgi:hypothetical protein
MWTLDFHRKAGRLQKFHNKETVLPGSDRTSPRSTGQGAFHTPRLCQPRQPSFYREKERCCSLKTLVTQN